MNQTNSGNNELSIDEQVNNINRLYEEYINGLGLNSSINEQVKDIIDMSYDVRERLSSQECADKAFVLAQTSFYIQRQINKHIMVIEWAKKKVDYMVAQHYSDYNQYVPYEVRKMQFIKENSYAQKLFNIQRGAELKLNSISYLPSQLKFLAERLESMRRSKETEK